MHAYRQTNHEILRTAGLRISLGDNGFSPWPRDTRWTGRILGRHTRLSIAPCMESCTRVIFTDGKGSQTVNFLVWVRAQSVHVNWRGMVTITVDRRVSLRWDEPGPRLEGFHKPDRKRISLTSVLLPMCWNEVLQGALGSLENSNKRRLWPRYVHICRHTKITIGRIWGRTRLLHWVVFVLRCIVLIPLVIFTWRYLHNGNICRTNYIFFVAIRSLLAGSYAGFSCSSAPYGLFRWCMKWPQQDPGIWIKNGRKKIRQSINMLRG